LAEMTGLFEQFTLITQNVDGLHRQAGSANVLELHGNISRNKCFNCARPFEGEIDVANAGLPECECGGKIRPDVVWFGEMLPQDVINNAFVASERSDLFFSVGTSALVHPAASLPITAKQNGAYLVEINLDPTPLTEYADFAVHGKSGEILPGVVQLIIELKS